MNEKPSIDGLNKGGSVSLFAAATEKISESRPSVREEGGKDVDGKSDVDRPFAPERKDQARTAFEKAESGVPEPVQEKTRSADGGESIRGHALAPALNYGLGRGIDKAYAVFRISEEAANLKKEYAEQQIAAKNMEKADDNQHNQNKSRDNTGR